MSLLDAGPPAMIDQPIEAYSRPSPWRRWLPLGIMAILIALAYAFGLHRHLSLESLAVHHEDLKEFVADHLLMAISAYALLYILVVALSLPGAAALSIAGGLLFGWTLGAPVTIVAATIGATIVFLIVRTSLGALVAERAGPFVRKLSGGFARDAFNYLLFLRLVPAFPFFVVNAVAGLCGVRVWPFVLATFLGIIPGSFVFSYLGAGFDSVLAAQVQAHDACVALKGAAECPFEFNLKALVTPQMLVAFAALGLVALLPVIVKRFRKA